MSSLKDLTPDIVKYMLRKYSVIIRKFCMKSLCCVEIYFQSVFQVSEAFS